MGAASDPRSQKVGLSRDIEEFRNSTNRERGKRGKRRGLMVLGRAADANSVVLDSPRRATRVNSQVCQLMGFSLHPCDMDREG